MEKIIIDGFGKTAGNVALHKLFFKPSQGMPSQSLYVQNGARVDHVSRQVLREKGQQVDSLLKQVNWI